MKLLLCAVMLVASLNFQFDDSTAVIVPPDMARPSVGERVTDPAFGTTLTRLTDASESGGFATHIYSQLQAFSADNAYLLLIEMDVYTILRMDDLSRVEGLDTSPWNTPRWHPAQPRVIVHFDSNEDTTLRLQFTDVDSLTTETIFTFPANYERIRSNQSFDELSADGRWLAGMGSTADGDNLIFALNLEERALGAQLSLNDLYSGACQPDPEWGMVEPDWIGVSPLGDYLVIQWAGDGVERCHGLELFDIQTGAFVGRAYDGHQHGDLGVLPDGLTQFFMTYELYHPSGMLSTGLRLLPGTETASEPQYLQAMDWNGEHISCRGPDGVCLLTMTARPDDGWSALEGELILQFTDGTIRRLAHHRSSSCGYWVQPRASQSRDGRYVVFASDWGMNGCADNDLGRGDVYLLDLESE